MVTLLRGEMRKGHVVSVDRHLISVVNQLGEGFNAYLVGC